LAVFKEEASLRDGSLVGLALFAFFGSFMTAQGMWYQYHDICQSNLNPATKPYFCDPTVLGSVGALFVFCTVMGIILMAIWFAGRKVPE
jgi:uncharacterized membrane protein HdeD (DUF308 family)